MANLQELHHGAHSSAARELEAATARRLRARGLGALAPATDGTLSQQDLIAVRKALWALGALASTYEAVTRRGAVSVGAQRMIRNPGLRNQAQLDRATARLSTMRADRQRRADALAKERAKASLRAKIVDLALLAAANYRKDPAAYHYLAGGEANLVYLKPSPSSWRSDCSQFVASVFADAGAPSPAAPLAHEWASTWTIESSPHSTETTDPRPGDVGMYGSHGNTHHVELYVGEPGAEFVGHGSPPIDSLTPGRPDFYLTFDF